MSEQEIIEGNKLIAEFMEYRFKNQSKYWCIYPLDDNSFLRNLGWVEFNNLKFHSSWDWLMPVVEKVTSLIQEKLYIPIGKYKEYEEQHNLYGIQWRKLFDYQSYNFFKARIESIYKAIVEFIKWYNSCQKEK